MAWRAAEQQMEGIRREIEISGREERGRARLE